jgi:predicted ATPase
VSLCCVLTCLCVSAAATAALRAQFEALYSAVTKKERSVVVALKTQGREVVVKHAVVSRQSDVQVARMTFHDLCVNPLGAADYLVIASHFPEVFIEDVPLLSLETRNEVCLLSYALVSMCVLLLRRLNHGLRANPCRSAASSR